MIRKIFREIDLLGIKFHLYSGKALKKNNIWRNINNINSINITLIYIFIF